jgi:hypothetical protein
MYTHAGEQTGVPMAATDNHTMLATILVIDIVGSKVKVLATGGTDLYTRRSGNA